MPELGATSTESFGRRRRLPSAISQSGVSLIEVLVAVLVLSIAFLGIAALQALSLSTSNSAMARSMATIASYSILDAMRADSANARAGLYNTAAGSISTGSCPAAAGSLASYQINQWCSQLALSLGPTASTTIACVASGNCTITITFDDSRAGAASGAVGGGSQQVVTVAAL